MSCTTSSPDAEARNGEAAARPFLTAAWRHLVLANYCAEPARLHPHVPRGLELDLWDGQAYVSLVGFRFLDTRVRGIPIPGHRNFDEINLRFYVRRWDGADWRRGVVFIKEFVPRAAIAWVARWVYNEPYMALPTRHAIRLGGGISARYAWRHAGRWHTLEAAATGPPAPLTPGSEAEFICEHYWGYTAQRDGSTLEYRVEHPPWRHWTAAHAHVGIDAAALYGPEFTKVFAGPPASVYIAEGSPVAVYPGAPCP